MDTAHNINMSLSLFVIPHCNCECLMVHFFSFLDSVQQRIDGAAITLTSLSIGDLAQTLSAVDGTPAAVPVATAEGTITFLCFYFVFIYFISAAGSSTRSITARRTFSYLRI